MNARRILPVLLAALLLAACGAVSDVRAGGSAAEAPAADRAADPNPEAETTVVLVSPEGEEVAFDVEVAAEPAARQRGLMERTDLADDAGMLFLFPADREGGFWMKNTLIPLQIAYLDAGGVVLAILDMTPCTEDPCPSYNPGVPYRYALEVNAGAFDARGVRAGWRAELPPDLPLAS